MIFDDKLEVELGSLNGREGHLLQCRTQYTTTLQ